MIVRGVLVHGCPNHLCLGALVGFPLKLTSIVCSLLGLSLKIALRKSLLLTFMVLSLLSVSICSELKFVLFILLSPFSWLAASFNMFCQPFVYFSFYPSDSSTAKRNGGGKTAFGHA